MKNDKIAVVAGNISTAYGYGISCCFKNLLDGRSAIKPTKRFLTSNFISNLSAECDIDKSKGSTFFQLLKPILKEAKENSFDDTFYIFSSTLGDIESLEKDPQISEKNNVLSVLNYISEICKPKNLPILISSACSSSANAIIHAASMIKNEFAKSVTIISCDIVSEFIFSGFSTLQALSQNKSMPFDENKNGLNIGEGAAYLTIMKESLAKEKTLPILGYVEGWGTTSDAYNIVSPDPSGGFLTSAIVDAIEMAGINARDIGSICAHGTGTIFNDEMELNAIERVFLEKILIYSIKGGTGHTMGNAGLIEFLIALKSLEVGEIPPTIGYRHNDQNINAIVSFIKQKSEKEYALSINSGFGGINTAIILKKN